MKLEKAQIEGKSWMERIRAANKRYNEWENRFECKRMVDYYEGKQTRNKDDYVLNLFYSTIGIKEPTLLFDRPEFAISPLPGHADFNPEVAWEKCTLATDTLNTLIGQKQMDFSENIGMAIHDSFFRFGMVEVGYSAKWTLNPNAPKPEVAIDYDPDADPDKIVEPDELPEEEWIYTKRIPAERIRIGTEDCFQLDKANWVGYWEYIRIADIKAKGSGFSNFEDLPDPQPYNEHEDIATQYSDDPEQRGDLLKVWKIWDLRTFAMNVITEINETVIFQNDFKRLPLFGLRFHRRTKGWFPIPPTYNWKSAQDEQNEAKQQLRVHRRRSKRAFQVTTDSVDQEELDKLINGEDGVTIYTKVNAPINPIQNTPADSSIGTSLQTSQNDFNIIAGTTVEQRLQTSNSTATQAEIVNNRATVRESKEQAVVANWLCDIGLEILQQAIEKLSKPVWIKISSDTGEWGGEYQVLNTRYEQLMTDQLKGVGFNVQIQLSTLSPVANDQEMNKYLRFLSVLTQFPIISLHPSLVRETAYRLGYRNEKVIKYFMEAAQLAMIGKIEEGKKQAAALGLGDPQASGPSQDSGAFGGNNAQRNVNEMAPPELAQIAREIGTAAMVNPNRQ